ncbi:hypothetical protein GCM10022223_00760 [Kineosporia mesophila]|uniref:FG-GAP repeat protein n=1 Tax=Kineosporia mesophila TaxID=566012 RepID=A0ABP6YY18_9ACTN
MLTGLALALLTAGPALAAPPGRYSFDLTVAGVPTRTISGAKQAGALDVHFPDGRTQRLTQNNLGFGLGSYQRFGEAVSVRDLNGDGLSDLVVGAPGVASKGRTGHAYLLFQSATGFTAANARELDSNALPGDRLGAAVAISGRASSATVLDVWVGAPGRDVNGAKDAGAIYRYYLDTATGTASFNDVISQDTAELSQQAEAGDQFGEVLAEQYNGVVAGVPHEDAGSAKDAGEVVFVRTDITTDLLTPASTFTQNTGGVGGSARAGNRFGAAVSPFGVLVGAPGEDVGTAKDAGRVQAFEPGGASGSKPAPSASFTQNSRGIIGTAKAGNQYGASVAYGIFRCTSTYQAAIGAPGLDVGTAKDAGGVFVQTLPTVFGGNGCASKLLTQGRGRALGGTARSGDHLGRFISTLTGNPAGGSKRLDNLAVGAPGKDAARAANTGVAVVWNGKGKGVLKTFGYSGGNAKNQAYGSVFGALTVVPRVLS